MDERSGDDEVAASGLRIPWSSSLHQALGVGGRPLSHVGTWQPCRQGSLLGSLRGAEELDSRGCPVEISG